MLTLSNYFPVDLANVIKKAITIKTKVVTSDAYMVTLSDNGVATIIDLTEMEPIIVKEIRYIHDIFGGDDSHIFKGNTKEAYLISNIGMITIIDKTSWKNKYIIGLTDIIHITSFASELVRDATVGILFDVYINVRGDITIHTSSCIKFNFSEPVVSVAITTDWIFFLTVSGVVRIYYAITPSGDRLPDFKELTKEDSNKRVIIRDVVKLVSAGRMAVMIKLNHTFLYIDEHVKPIRDTIDIRRQPFGNVRDVALSGMGLILELLTNGRVNLSGELIPHVSNIIGISSGWNLVLIQADGRVLLQTYMDDFFTTIPRLRLTVK